MAFKLGVLGSEYDLPPISWEAGSPPELPEDHDLKLDTEEMLDGTEQHDFAEHTVRTWPLSWNSLTAAQVATLKTIAALKAELNFISEYHGLAGATVVVQEFTPAVRIETYATEVRWRATMTLVEVP